MKTRLLILLSCLLLLSLALFSCGGEAGTPPATGGDTGTAPGGDTTPGGNTGDNTPGGDTGDNTPGGNPEEPEPPRAARDHRCDARRQKRPV